MFSKNYKEAVFEAVDEAAVEAADEQQSAKAEAAESDDIFGTVTECLRLNIRRKPSKDAEIIAIAGCLDKVKIDPDASTDEWYAVCTVAGAEGFCMKKFIAIRQ